MTCDYSLIEHDGDASREHMRLAPNAFGDDGITPRRRSYPAATWACRLSTLRAAFASLGPARGQRVPQRKCKKCLAMALGIVKNGVILRSLGTNYAKI
jgi:hypothetical protein